MSYVERFCRDGYATLEDALPNRLWFEELYSWSDALIDELTVSMRHEWRRAAFQWLEEGDNQSYFCGVPPAYRDRHNKAGKRDKAYIQWCQEFAESPQYLATAVAQLDSAKRLCERMQTIQEICTPVYTAVLQELGAQHPEFLERYDLDRPLPIVMKLVRYNEAPQRFATDPHFDKSALSMILRADDDSVRWRVGQGNPCRLSTMHAPFDYPKDDHESNPAVVFPGLCLEAAGVPVPPTPHFVMPVIDRPFRHSTIAFLVVPHLENADALVTDAPYIQDALANIS